jgi:hypothetical protein
MIGQQGWRASKSSSGGGGLTELAIQNTIYVSKNGNDATGTRNLWNLPFLTIAGAKAVAQAGDCIYVFAGTYNEGSNDVIESDVKYYFELGAKLICDFECISDFGIAKNIDVDGFGDFEITQLNFGKATVLMSNPLSTLRFRGNRIIGTAQAFAILDCDNYDFEAEYATCSNQYVVTIRGNSKGRCIIKNLEQPVNAPAILYRNLGTDSVARNHFLKINTLTSVDTLSQAVVTTINTFNSKTWIEIENIEYTGANGRLFQFWSGVNYVKNTNGVMSGGGIAVETTNGNSINLFENCNLVGDTNSVLLRLGNTEFVNCELISGGTGTGGSSGSVFVFISAFATFRDCLLVEKSSVATRCVLNMFNITPTNFNVRLMNCKLVGENTNNFSIKNGASTVSLTGFYVEGQCVTNRPIEANMTNLIAGSNIIVDDLVSRNPQNFFGN